MSHPPVTSVGQSQASDVADIEELQHFAELGRLSATLLHEMSNPLSAALIYLDQVANPASPQVVRAKRNIKELRRYVEAARQQLRRESPRRIFRVGPHIAHIRRLLGPFARLHHVQLTIDPAPDFRLYGDPVKFQQAVTNLVVNAVEAYREDTRHELARPVRVSFEVFPRWLKIYITDWGEGIAASDIRHIFQPFFSTKRHKSYGLGIGLSIVHQYITQEFKGSIRVRCSSRHGTQFILALPAPKSS